MKTEHIFLLLEILKIMYIKRIAMEFTSTKKQNFYLITIKINFKEQTVAELLDICLNRLENAELVPNQDRCLKNIFIDPTFSELITIWKIRQKSMDNHSKITASIVIQSQQKTLQKHTSSFFPT